jgi:hypothetical protein
VLDQLPAARLSLHFPQGDHAWETWRYVFWFPSGYLLSSQLSVTNVGPGDRSAIALGLILAPDGKYAALRNSRKRNEWSYTADPSGLQISLARHRFEISGRRHHIQMMHGDGSMEIEAERTTDVFQPRPIQFDDRRFLDFAVIAPRLKVKGRAQITGEQPVELLDGVGIATHAYSNFAEFRQAVTWLRFETFDREIQVSLLEFRTPQPERFQRVPMILVFRRSELVYHSFDCDREYLGYDEDPEKPGYPVPKAFRFSSNGGGKLVRGDVQLRQIYRLDVLSWVKSGFIRWLARRSSHPIDYKFRADYRIAVDLGDGPRELVGTGYASVAILNRPPSDF